MYIILLLLQFITGIAFFKYSSIFEMLSNIKDKITNLYKQLFITGALCIIQVLWIIYWFINEKRIEYFGIILLVVLFAYMVKTYLTINKAKKLYNINKLKTINYKL